MNRLHSTQLKKLILTLCKAIATLNKPDEVAEFLLDFLSPRESETIAKRLKIAELLAQGHNYEEIRSIVGVGFSTIARVHTWLDLSGKGLKLVLERKPKNDEDDENKFDERYDPSSWTNFKRRHALYFWPELVIEEIIKRSDKKEKDKIMVIIDEIKSRKKSFSPEENKMLYNQFKDFRENIKRKKE